MLLKFLFALLLSFVCVDIAQAQLTYSYSATGNRQNVHIGFAKIAATPDEQEEYTETLDNIQFKIFPNPTKGLLKINIDTDVKIEDLKIEMFDVNGKKIIDKSVLSKEIELDITDALAGTYFMKIFVNNKPYFWNILKDGK